LLFEALDFIKFTSYGVIKLETATFKFGIRSACTHKT